MLVLTRKLGESLRIGDDISIKIVEVKGKSIKIGVSAPKKYVIHREEIYLKIQEENSLAANIRNRDVEKVSKLWEEIHCDRDGKK